MSTRPSKLAVPSKYKTGVRASCCNYRGCFKPQHWIFLRCEPNDCTDQRSVAENPEMLTAGFSLTSPPDVKTARQVAIVKDLNLVTWNPPTISRIQHVQLGCY